MPGRGERDRDILWLMDSRYSLAPARQGRQIAAGLIDGFICALIFSIGPAIDSLIPSLGREEAPEQITRFLLWPMIATALCLWYSRTELRSGTLGQRIARIKRVQLDGRPLQSADWWRMHWPLLLFVAYGVLLVITSIVASASIKQDWIYIEWMQFWGTIISLAAVAVLIASYAFTRATRRTMLIEKPRPYTGHGFEVQPIKRSGRLPHRSP